MSKIQMCRNYLIISVDVNIFKMTKLNFNKMLIFSVLVYCCLYKHNVCFV